MHAAVHLQPNGIVPEWGDGNALAAAVPGSRCPGRGDGALFYDPVRRGCSPHLMELALKVKTADPVLAALLRDAVTAGKRARTEVTVARGDVSMGSRCRDILERELGSLKDKRILVIGNGQMGRLAARLLRESGAAVWVTLRTYRHGETVVPAGCGTVNYGDRVQAMEGMDAVVSATTSPPIIR